MQKQETYIYQIYDLVKKDFFEIDILNDKIKHCAIFQSKDYLEDEVHIIKIHQIATIDEKPFLKFTFTFTISSYEFKRLNLIVKMKGVNIYED